MLEGMYEEAAETEESVAAGEFKKYAFISVAMGEGMKNIFKDLGVDYVISYWKIKCWAYIYFT